MQTRVLDLVQRAHKLLLGADLKIATAESCTAGLLSAALTEMPGSSAYFLGGVNAYANEVKKSLLDVSEALLRKHGAVSAQVVESMARGIRERTSADVGISLTGIAGPDGGTPDKPVGTVWLGFATDGETTSRLLQLAGSRSEIRTGAVVEALQLLIQYLEKHVV